MDKKIIQQYGKEILCYRLRTARQKTRLRYEDFHKHLIQLHKIERQLMYQWYNRESEPLIPPIQRGWIRSFVLRDDVAQSRHAEFFQGILDKINTYDWSYRKDFLVKYRRYGRKKYKVKSQSVRELYPFQFRRLEFTEAEKKFFDLIEFGNRWGEDKRYVFREPWRFVLRTRPNMIDKVPVHDGELKSQIDRISNYMDNNAYRGKQTKLLHGNDRWRCKCKGLRHDEADPLKNKAMSRILDEAKLKLL